MTRDPLLVHLRNLRLDRGMSIEDLATLLKISKATLGSWERDERHVSYAELTRWAHQLGVRPVLLPLDDTDYGAVVDVLRGLATLVALKPSVDALAGAVRIAKVASTVDSRIERLAAAA
ncbi:MAG TPA: helix-turn-helix transcriptional regulator [Candidatus Binatia bacterium]|nr:helix-turn-helix transcriptional regulator [Candidatus Binatia bacterium]